MNAERDAVDVMCRFARMAAQHPDKFFHVCTRRDGRKIRPLIDDCFFEARAQFLEMRPSAR